MVKLILVRGPSGSGKTTFAESMKMDHVEADHYFVRPDLMYDFNPRQCIVTGKQELIS